MTTEEAGALDSYSVLLAEDNPTFRTSIRDALDVLGFTAHEVSSGHEALAALEKNKVDIAIVDIRMEDGDGIEFLETLAARGVRLPVILMSAYPIDALLDRARAAGYTCFLPKPFSLEDLSAAIIAAVAEANGASGRG